MNRPTFGSFPSFKSPRSFALLLVALVAAMPLLGTQPARAATTFTVNLAGDAPDANLGDGKCDASAGTGPQCTLRAAIQQANAGPGADTIAFAIPGGGPKTITLATALPTITRPVTIDGYTQPGSKVNTAVTGTNAVLRIEINGVNVGEANGLTIDAPKTVIRGVVINRFGRSGVVVGERAAGTRIAGCFIGTDPAGTQDRGNGAAGVGILATDVTVGGATVGARNLISGNGTSGVSLVNDAAPGNRVQGNLIGTTKNGTSPLKNVVGIVVTGSGNTIGGNTAAAANRIGFHDFAGVEVLAGTGNRILRNAIFFNGGEGIDLAGDGPTANDFGDGDTGPNNRQNTPVLTAATTTGSGSTVRGRLNSTPNRTCVVRFFSNPTATGDEGQTFRGQLSVTTDGGGTATFAFAPIQLIPEGQTVTVTATSGDGDTSEFSTPVTVQ